VAELFTPYSIRGVTLRNRIVVSPMCQYSSDDGFANDWHLQHLGCRAVGGAALVFTEATAVSPEARISPQDLGLYHDAHVDMLKRIASLVKSQGAAPGIQLAHAGRKASTKRPWEGRDLVPLDQGGWEPVAPSALKFVDYYAQPRALDEAGIAKILGDFARAAQRALAAGFEIIELHAAHGYLLHEFLSPLSNQRTDSWGGSFDNRVRIVLETVRAIRAVWPERLPLFVRLSCTDWADGGWTDDDAVELASRLTREGVDLVDCSTGGLTPAQKIPVAPGFQVPFAARIRREAGMPAGAVGLITEPQQANGIIERGDADLVSLARQLLRDPYWPLHAARALGVEVPWPVQYERARLPGPATAGPRT
jgi:2,4-dienoyl-CoA reductase-like NADH-dependent reductase (Old Yellow Enzyme family)